MGTLSPLVSHGQLVWQLFLVLAALAGISLAWALPRRALVRRAARLRESLGKPEASLDSAARDKPVVLVGTVKKPDELAEGASSLIAATLVPEGMERAEELSQKARTAVIGGGPLVVEVFGKRVFVEGTPQVLVGSQESGKVVDPKRVRLTLWELASELSDLKNVPLAIRTVSHGDRVIVAGKLRHEPDAATPQTYRSGSGAYFLAPDETESKTGMVPVVFEGDPRPLAQSRGALVAQVLAVPACALVLLGAVGEVAIRAAQASETSAAMATVTPFRRSEGLAALRAHVNLGELASDETLARAARIDLVRGYCGTASDTYAAANRPEEAAKTAEQCRDPFRAARAYFVAGDVTHSAASFAEARKRDPKLPPSISEVTAYFTTEMYDDAATVGHALLASWEGARGTRDDLQCVVDALDARGGGTHPQGGLERHAQEEGTRVSCSLILLDATDENVRKAAEERLRYVYSDRVLLYSSLLTRGSKDPLEKPYYGYGRAASTDAIAATYPLTALFTRPKNVAFEVPPSLALESFRSLAAENSPKAFERMTRAALAYVSARAYLGDEEGALATLDELDRKLAPFSKRSYTDGQKAEWDNRTWRISNDEPVLYQRALEAEEARLRKSYDPEKDLAERTVVGLVTLSANMRAGVLLHAGKTKESLALLPATPTTARWGYRSDEDLFRTFLEVRASHSPRALDVLAGGDGRESNRKLWLAAQSGEGKNLAARLREQRADGRGVLEIAGHQIPEGKAELSHWVRFEYPAPCSTCGLFPLMNYLASRLDAARAVGDTKTVDELVASRKRLDPVLARREGAIVVQLLSELSPP